ncbi:MAG TPA: hypothetical protein VJM10_00220 [Candidatus Methylomirabilis sp.]|nr:hypothetical protein [Candidatus Methylomirabilis sp.]
MDAGYEIVSLVEYTRRKRSGGRTEKIAALRVDADCTVKKAEVQCGIFDDLGIKGSFFFRLHAKQYNLLDFESYRIVKKIRARGHEIGLHTELVDQSLIWSEDPEVLLRRDLAVMVTVWGGQIWGSAAHGDVTGNNNLDFWNGRKPEDFSLVYEAYDRSPAFGLFYESRYVSDSEWFCWKAYENGVLLNGDHRAPAEHAKDSPQRLYLLIHSDTYYHRHIHE